MAWLEYLLPLIFLAPPCATALVVIALRRLFSRRLVSPVTQRPLREPGQHLRDRLDTAQTRLFLVGGLGPIMVMLPLVYGMGRMLFAPRQDWIEWSFYGLLCTLAVMIACGLLMRLHYHISHLRLSLSCALEVHHTLDEVCHQASLEGHRDIDLLHDVPGDGFSIGHVVLTRQALFVITTKGRQRPPWTTAESPVRVQEERLLFPHNEERRPLREARRAARWLEARVNRDADEAIPVQAVLVLPGWQINDSDRNRGISIVNEAGLSQLIAGADAEIIPIEQYRRIDRLLRRLPQT
ncbi:nuclease-like protein [Kushneria sinocarnis]|uniref:Nuclease-like protein n=1 Tax=Kushneria sinocarnis TaxID=595502 RepID=A0A420WW52_9GAMM|nr:nuclease-related domain-containing protein [Kushneria sinocarnis]RKR03322.1 nuclease-like protein [Kushneria sinocarnis]